MSQSPHAPLLVGEIFVDFTTTSSNAENNLRLGGITHAARAFWALNVPFRAAVILPSYLEDAAHTYLSRLGCIDFRVIGLVTGAPNVTVIFDATEVADQGYETLLRDEKVVSLTWPDSETIEADDALIFPGSYDLHDVCALLSKSARIHIDVGYDVNEPSALNDLKQPIETIFISTSSDLFVSLQDAGVRGLYEAFSKCSPSTVILKENRGGSQLFVAATSELEALPAQLGITINSVGVGDVFAAAYLACLDRGHVEAAWRATYASAAYSQTTEPDIFKTYLLRDQRLSLKEMQELWGTFLPWERRRDLPIYLAAPDFAFAARKAIDQAIQSLSSSQLRCASSSA
jgi:hypothetical protein